MNHNRSIHPSAIALWQALLPVLLVAVLASCRSHKNIVEEQPSYHLGPDTPPVTESRTETRRVTIDLTSTKTFMDNNTFVKSRYRFRDLNGEQLKYARKSGVDPVQNREEAEKLKKRLNLVESNEYYMVDELTHSIPYLTDGAKKLLDDMGRMYQQSLINAGYRPHRFIVTSLLRTRDDVERLRKVNGNAAKNSSHMYGTTFDLSWSRYNRVSMDGNSASNATLAAYLGEVIHYMRSHGRCVVIYEQNQHCFHITSTE